MTTQTITQQAMAQPACVLEVTVHNHPGVLAHVCSLFARRAYNLEAVFCLPFGTAESRIWLLVNEQQRLEQIQRQLLKLHDVYSVRRHDAGRDVFVRLEALLR
jgi:acetolactate synthase-1/3 small subunit